MRISDNWKINAACEFAISAGITAVFFLLDYRAMFYLGLILTFGVTPSRAIRHFLSRSNGKRK